MRVLLVEDEPDLGAAIKRTLTQQKYLVDWVIDIAVKNNVETLSHRVYTRVVDNA